MLKYDLAIRWNDDPKTLARIISSGIVPIRFFPNLFRDGGKVALITKGGIVRLLFDALTIEGPKTVTLAGGERRPGYIIRARKRSIRPPEKACRLRIQWIAIGQWRYFDARTCRSVLVGNGGDFPSAPGSKPQIIFHPFMGEVPGRSHNDPEAQLVRQYVDWLKDPEGFANNYIPQAHLYVDLFDRRKWRLIEAKAAIERERIRTAVGQLFDYRCFYAKSPSLGILLPEKPTAPCLSYLEANRITAVWCTPSGIFNDSTGSRLWTGKRRH
jgi:hypothetical protein